MLATSSSWCRLLRIVAYFRDVNRLANRDVSRRTSLEFDDVVCTRREPAFRQPDIPLRSRGPVAAEQVSVERDKRICVGFQVQLPRSCSRHGFWGNLEFEGVVDKKTAMLIGIDCVT